MINEEVSPTVLRFNRPFKIAAIQHGVARRLATDECYRGGDLFAYCPLSSGKTNVLIADVSSKGRYGVVHAEMLWSTFLRLSMSGSGPATILRELNALRFEVRQRNAGTVFASAFVGAIDPDRAELVHASAGHELALLFRSRAHTHLEPTGPVLGVIPGATYENSLTTFGRSDVLLLATDGVTESRYKLDPKSQFGTNGLVRSIDGGRLGSATAIANRVMSASEAFCESNRRDDATVAAIRYNTRQ